MLALLGRFPARSSRGGGDPEDSIRRALKGGYSNGVPAQQILNDRCPKSATVDADKIRWNAILLDESEEVRIRGNNGKTVLSRIAPNHGIGGFAMQSFIENMTGTWEQRPQPHSQLGRKAGVKQQFQFDLRLLPMRAA